MLFRSLADHRGDYAKAMIVRKQLAQVLAEKIIQGQYRFDDAMNIARAILFEAPQSLLGLKPRSTGR